MLKKLLILILLSTTLYATDRAITNDPNRNLSKNQEIFKYDPNGNLIYKRDHDGEVYYTYDSLDRLISIIKPNEYVLEYEYDPLNRRISKKYHSYHEYMFSNEWIDEYEETYLYDDQNEIASLDENGNIKELRVLGDADQAEIGSSIAIEIKDQIYIPIHDIQGNVSCLVSKDTNKIVEYYRYSAFGEEKIFDEKGREYPSSQIDNFWRFSSKRTDESKLVYFGRRYYDPEHGRWITADPEGFVDGLNLYAFVLNDPLTHMDLYGLFLVPPIMLDQSNFKADYVSEYSFPKYNNSFDFKSFIQKDHSKTLGFVRNFIKSEISQMIFHDDPVRRIEINNNNFSDGRHITAVFGIRTNSNEGINYANLISNYAGGHNVHLLHNETRGIIWDAVRAAYELFLHGQTQAVKDQRASWEQCLRNPKSSVLHVTQSEGAIVSRNALESMPENLRSRINVVAIAPGGYIDENLCNNRTHYTSRRDFVPLLDILGRWKNRSSTIKLKPHPNANLLDHNFNSPTYKFFLKNDINDYVR